MKIKTSELTGPALDWAAAYCLGKVESNDPTIPVVGHQWDSQGLEWPVDFEPSTNWAQAGPIIERECITTSASGACSIQPKNPDYWVAEIFLTDEIVIGYGPTPLIAAMRCFVASRLGDKVDVPNKLCQLEG